MKKILVIFFLVSFNITAEKFLIDSIDAAIFGPEGTDIITKSDVERPALDGSMHKKEDLIYEALIYQDAKKYRIIPDEEAIDKNLKAVQRENNLSLEQLNNIFKSGGYTPQEGRDQFRKMTAVNQMVNFKVGQQLIIPEKEVKKYYEDNPETQQARFLIARAVVPFSKKITKDQLKQKIKKFVGAKKGNIFKWSSPFWVEKGDIAKDKMFIISMDTGDISMPTETEEGFELFLVKEKKDEQVRSLEDRYGEIVNILRPAKSRSLLEAYKKELMDGSSILYFDVP